MRYRQTCVQGTGCVTNLDKLKRFKIGQTGLDAETHEVVAEAKDTIKRMQKLAKAYGSMMITQAESSQYVSGPSPQERDAVKDAVAELLSEFDLGEDEIAEVEQSGYRYICSEYRNLIVPYNLKKKIRESDKSDIWNEYEQQRGQLQIGDVPDLEKLENILDSVGELTPEREELLEDLRYYEANKRHRRPDIWRQRGDGLD